MNGYRYELFYMELIWNYMIMYGDYMVIWNYDLFFLELLAGGFNMF